MQFRTLCLLLLLCLPIITACAKAVNAPDLTLTSTPFATPASAPTEVATPGSDFQLVWQDEFDGDTVDDTKWSLSINNPVFNNELQLYTDLPDNAFIEEGHLVIQAIKPEESYMGRDYTSAKLTTLAKADWLYGRFEIRAKLPTGQGLWPAFWLLPSQGRYGGWPSSGEMDIMEMLGHEPNIVHGTLHYRDKNGHAFNGQSYQLPEGDFTNEFHVFAFEWDETEMRWYVDDELYLTLTTWETRNKPFPAPFDQKFYLIINLAVGGNWPGSPDETTVFPQRLEVDYVRVYQKNASNTD
jgi:beta-glucanase (GH16 family)